MFNNKENKDVFVYALHKWGFDSQLGMLQEECIEFNKAQSEFEIKQTPSNFKEWYSELADIMVMVDQMKVSVIGKRIIETKKNFKSLNIYGLLENRHRLSYLTSSIALCIRKFSRSGDKDVLMDDLINNIGALDVLLDDLKKGDEIGSFATCDVVQGVYQYKVKRLWNRLTDINFKN